MMKIFLRKRPLLLFVTVAFFFMPSRHANAEAEERYVSGDAYVSAGIGDARVLIPLFADDTTSSSICGLVYNGLTKVDKDLNVVGDLAERWEVSEGGLAITFFLRKNVKWHDGEPFTAKDVKFTFDTILKKETGCPYISSYSDIREIRIIDDHTVTFFYTRPYAPALLKLGMGIIPEHIFAKEKDIRSSAYARAPVGTGPYRFSKWESGQYIVLDANQEYFEHVPGLKRYVYELIPDQAVQYLELVSEGIDSMELNPYQYLYRSGIPEFKKRINKYKYLSFSYTYIGYNMKDPLFADKKVRQALSFAINKKEMIESVLFGLGEDCTGPFIRDSIYYDKEVSLYSYDPAKAKGLLAEAGWADTDGDGVLEKDGIEFRIKLVTNQGNQVREDVATIVQRQWAKIGVAVEIQVVAWAAFLDQFIEKKNFQVTLLGWSLPVDPDCHPVFHSDSMGPGGLNFVSYSNPEVDRLIEEGKREFDLEKRAVIYKKMHRIIAGDAPYTFLFFGYSLPAINKRFQGVRPAPAGIGYNFIDWYVDEDEVRYRF